jgi:FkbM family methyltransferase
MHEALSKELTVGGTLLRFSLPRPDDLIQKRIAGSGTLYEQELLEHAQHLLRPDDVVLDVGANIGTHTVYFGAVCRARVVAFEPHPESARTLRENVRLNDLAARVTVHEIGLGAASARADLSLDDAHNLGHCTLRPTHDGPVVVRAFDDLGLADGVKLVKIDVEGMEAEVLAGMAKLLQQAQPALYVEIQSNAELGRIQAQLERFGYVLVECFNSTPTYCFLPASTAEQRFRALMSRWDASLRARQRANGATLAQNDRGQLAGQVRDLAAAVARLERRNATRDGGKSGDDDGSRQLQNLQVQMNGVSAQLERLLQAYRQDRQQRWGTRLLNALANPKKALQALRRKFTGKPAVKATGGRTATSAPIRGDELVSVVMTTHDSAAFVAEAVRSILDQTHRHLELLVVDDASRDDTPAILARLQAGDERLRVLSCHQNRGTYWAKNLGIRHARGRFVTLQDSDDTSAPDRIQKQLAALAAARDAVAVSCNYVRVDEHGKVVLNRGLEQRLGLITLLFDKATVLDRMGFYDSVRTSADAEFLQRLRLCFGKAGVAHVDEPLYIARARADSLSAGDVDLQAGKSQPEFLSAARAQYVTAYEQWHAATNAPRLPFPLRRRPFEAPAELVRDCLWGDDFVTVSMASIPSRRAGLSRVVAALLDQVDQLNVYLNHYDDVPTFLRHPRIRVERSQDHGDLRDNGKFFFLADARPGYYLTVDDDIVYPPDYVDHLLAKLRQYADRAIVGLHGTILPAKVERFFAPNGRTVLSFKHELVEDRQVHLLGTGTTAWHTRAIPLAFGDFASTGMADLWLGAAAQRHRVPMFSVARPNGWLRPIEDLDSKSLFDEFVNDDGPQTRLVQQMAPWQLPPLPGPTAPTPTR